MVLEGSLDIAARAIGALGIEGMKVADKNGMTIMHHAVRLNAINIVKAIYNRCDELGYSSLPVSLTERFTKASGKPGHWLPLHIACEKKASMEVIRELVENMDGLDGKTSSGATPLMLASARGYVEAVTYLLEHRANANITDNSGKTALDIGSRNSAVVADILRQHGGIFAGLG